MDAPMQTIDEEQRIVKTDPTVYRIYLFHSVKIKDFQNRALSMVIFS